MLVKALVAVALVAMAGATAYAKSDMSMSTHVSVYTPTSMKWMPGTGDMKGLQVAALEGDPSKPGPWTIRIKFPAGTKFPVHYHPDTERVTVISGAIWVAVGNKYDATKLMALPPGSYAVIPAGIRHYAAMKVETVIQLSGTAPFAMKMDKTSDTNM